MSEMGIYSDFQLYANMHFIRSSLHLFQGREGKPNSCKAPLFRSFHFYFQKACS